MSLVKKLKNIDQQVINDYNDQRLGGPRPVLCYAPFNSMYFASTGAVPPCCFRRHLVDLCGKYPEQSISEIWQGQQYNLLRNKMMINDFSGGCDHVCQKDLLNKNFKTFKGGPYDFLDCNPRYPARMDFELSNNCNLSCIMCRDGFSYNVDKKLTKNNEKYGAMFVKELEEFIPYLKKVNFFGGEPFMIDIYYDIWEKIMLYNSKCEISVQTNGTIVNDKVKSFLNNGYFCMSISLDAIDKNVYEAIRVGAKYDEVMNNIVYFDEYTKKQRRYLNITACIMQQNWQEMPKLVEFCNKNYMLISFHKVFQPERCSLSYLDSKKLDEIYCYYKSFKFPESNEVEIMNKNKADSMIGYIQEWYEDAKQRESGQ